MKVVLASSSPRRAKLLKQINISFEVDPSDVDENSNNLSDPVALVEYLAMLKGRDVAARHKDSFIIAADTIVCLHNEILGKPEDEEHAFKTLKMLNNYTHQVFTGVFLCTVDQSGNISREISFTERTNVTFGALTDSEINHYILTKSPMDKAGAYGIQDDLGSLFVKRIDGDYYNVVGFPLHAFYQQVKTSFPELSKKLFFNT
ncbi:MAG: septum formation protein Maf [Balneolaceae bacterium]|nr:MAG: septum formation protein Maf [Balneolaceae bacterium]